MPDDDWDARFADARGRQDRGEMTQLIWELRLGLDRPRVRTWTDYERRVEADKNQGIVKKAFRTSLSITERKLAWEGSRASLSWLAPNGEIIQHFLADTPETCTIGRDPHRDVVLNSSEVSRRHALMTAVGRDWWIEDARSTNGTLIRRGAEAVIHVPPQTREMLVSGDLICLGNGELRFIDDLGAIPGARADGPMTPPSERGIFVREKGLTSQESKVLNLLCAPRLSGGGWKTNAEIAAELVIAKETVRSHMKALYSKFSLPENGWTKEQRRDALVEHAIAGGWVSPPARPGQLRASTDPSTTQRADRSTS